MDKKDDTLSMSKIAEYFDKRENEERNNQTVGIILGVIAGLAAVAVIAFAVYRFLSGRKKTDNYEDDFEDEFDDDDDDDDFDDDLDDFEEEED